MRIRSPILIFAILALLLLSSFVAGAQTLTLSGDRTGGMKDKRFEKKTWGQAGQMEADRLAGKRFPIKDWNKHFSSVGSKRAPIAVEASGQREVFATKTLDRDKVDFGMARWNRSMAELHEKAGIEIDDRARIVDKQKLYTQLMQDAKHYSETGKTLSLRDINRYQFRRNRPDGDIPVESAGAE